MSERDPTRNEATLAEGDVAEILERAVRLDNVRHTKISVEQLREAALEVGVSREAFDTALKEFARRPAEASQTVVPAPEKRPRFFSQIRTALTVAAGALVGSLGALL